MTTSFRAVATTATLRCLRRAIRRKNTPSGPGWVARCWAAWVKSQRASELPALVIGPWRQMLADCRVEGTRPM